MRHHKIVKTLRRRKGGAWYDPRTWFEKKPEEAVQAAPAAAEQAVSDVVTPLGATSETSGVPGGMSELAPASLGGRRRKTRKSKTKRHTRKSRR